MTELSSAFRAIFFALSFFPTSFCQRLNLSTYGCGTISPETMSYFARSNASPNEFPWMTYLAILFKDSRIPRPCQGVLISPDLIMTTATCVTRELDWGLETAELIVATLGRFDLSEKGATKSEVTQFSASITIHPDFPATYGDPRIAPDFAVVKLRTPVNLTAAIQPICIPEEMCTEGSRTIDITDTCSIGISSEWTPADDQGHLGELTKATREIMAQSACESVLYGNDPYPISKTKFCASQLSEDACLAGTPSHPLVCSYLDKFYLLGVMAFDFSGCEERNKTTTRLMMYSRMCHVVPWLKDQFRLDGQYDRTSPNLFIENFNFQQPVGTSVELLTYPPISATCAIPMIPNGAAVVTRGRASNEGLLPQNGTIRIRCFTGFTLYGSTIEHVCTDEGKWQPSDFGYCIRGQTVSKPPLSNTLDDPLAPMFPNPQPHLVECPSRPAFINNGYFTAGSSTVGSIRYVGCYDGFTLVGNATITCLPDASWSKSGLCMLNKSVNKFILNSVTSAKPATKSVLSCPRQRAEDERMCYSICRTDGDCPSGYLCCGTCPRLCEKGMPIRRR